ncbi:MAG: haloalkane dehalogenase [Pseudomonadota bacterium]
MSEDSSEKTSVVTHAEGKKDVPVDQLMVHIGTEFPYASKYIEIDGLRMRYVDEGEGDPIVFIHGNPTSAYLWRNVMPHLEGSGRIVAFDMIGMGESDKPDIEYSMEYMMKTVDAFFEKMDLKNVTLVVHDWGGAIGLHYARRFEGNVKGIAFMEANVPPAIPVAEFEDLGPETGAQFRYIHSEDGGTAMLEENFFIEHNFRGKIVRNLTDREMRVWRDYYPTAASRRSALDMARDTPMGVNEGFAFDNIKAYGEWMTETDLPMLMCWCKPGIIINEEVHDWLVAHVSDIESHYLGIGLHYVQEDHP